MSTHHIDQIEEKIRSGERINDDEALFLYHTPNVHALGRMAEIVRQRWNGNKAYYIVNRHINYSNICVDDCKFCAFARKPGEDEGFEYSIKEMLQRADEGVEQGAIEFHIVGGLHPDLPYSYYIETLQALKERHPQVHLKCYTAVEISHLARLSKKNIKEVLEDLIQAGLGSLPGGGAEMFSERVRDKMCPDKLYVDEWLDVHRTAHALGLRSNATMLYGHVEQPEEIIDHLAHLRPLQDETQGFMTFIPLHFQPKNTRLTGVLGTGMKDLRVHAVSRIYLDNFPHIKSYWTMLGVKSAQVMLRFGADDFDGTVIDEKIVHMAGSSSPKMLTVSMIRQLIEEAGREPVERDTLFNPVDRNTPLPAVVA
ncbi:MAG: aminofutalosine synthase MqnE [Candidatus Hinthialibacter antarcticus]|nr:aminofutalosine synthase MqnE [Candidatus Hinthialibacter antarcticus]